MPVGGDRLNISPPPRNLDRGERRQANITDFGSQAGTIREWPAPQAEDHRIREIHVPPKSGSHVSCARDGDSCRLCRLNMAVHPCKAMDGPDED